MPPDETPQATSETPKKPRYFYGWNIVAATFLAQLSYSEHHSSVLGFFIRPFNREFGWSRTEVALVQTIARFVEAPMGFFVGPIIDKYGPRYLMPTGAVILGFAMLGATYSSSIWQFWMLRGVVVAVGFTIMGGMVSNVTINKFFVRKRGRAIAIASMGNNLGSVIMVPVTVWILATYGWRASFTLFAVLTWIVVLVPSYVLMRRQPEDLGLHPDGIEPDTASAVGSLGDGQEQATTGRPAGQEPVWTRREVMATKTFWMLVAGMSAANLAFQGINISLAPYMQDLNYGATLVAAAVTARAVIRMVVLPAWGWAADYPHIAWIRSAPFLCQALASLLFLMGQQPIFLWMAVLTYSIGFGGVMVIQEVLWANFYGRMSLGLVRSTGVPFAFAFSAAGPIFMNGIFDLMGSYRPAYMLFILFYCIAAVMLWYVRAPTPVRYVDIVSPGS
jgi:MFS family permease